ncbi:phosphotransferase enzyme family protein [Mycetocola reblochoni]|uniref:Aminoglycoside phosphotransferase n=2 Tax=Mycetocola reblochoni TaxID=331618 RepID=A0A1R4JYD4_9MICO|nr:phosphotransferase [Mycetocola reblochoni]RLP67965.1 aminoglycoside phosphotransferase [Mycetocola reblochoni]SJN37090.1 Aminoglycoside phosphotransferase [Mycetocola reblochoni REB411]
MSAPALRSPGTAEAWVSGIDAALAAYGLTERAVDSRLVSLSENASYIVELSGGERIVVRLHRPGYRRLAEIEGELAWISALRSAGVVDTPAIRPSATGSPVASFRNADGHTQHAVVFEFVEGTSPDSGDPSVMTAVFARLGGLTARLHRHAMEWNAPAGFERMEWTLDTAIGEASAWASWRSNREVDDATRELLERVEQRVRTDIADYEARGGRTALLHGDLPVTNLLLHGDRLTVIDFDDAGTAWLMWDLACALSFIESDPAVPQLVEAWIGGYAAAGELRAEDLAVIPALVMLRRLLLVGWMESRQGTPEHTAMVGSYVPDTVRIGSAYLDGRFLTDVVDHAGR